MTGADILMQALIREEVDVIFGYPGGQILPVYDALYKTPEIKHILARHEQGAVHAADGYARVTGKVGVVLATSGPGATNLVTGIANAHMDSVPLVCICGQVPLAMLGRDSFQEADITGITLPITKHSYLVRDVKDLARVVKEAFYIASTGRPGPVLIDLPKDVGTSSCEPEYPEEVQVRGYRLLKKVNHNQIRQVAEAISKAEKPVLISGGGVIISGASSELLDLVTRQSIPVVSTLMGLGGFPGRHPLHLGMLGMHGTKAANYAVSHADLVISLGARFSDRTTGTVKSFARNAKIIHVDIDPAEIGKNVRTDVPVVGDIKQVLEGLLEQSLVSNDHQVWLDQINEWQSTHPLCYRKPLEGGRIKPQYVIEQIHKLAGPNTIITTEVGQNQMWAAQFFPYSRPRSFISSGGLGTMGYGLPAAIGAQMGAPDALVIDIAGDGSIQMNSQEFCTAVTYGLPVKVVILNNGYLGMVRQWQQLFYDRRYSCVDLCGSPDFVKLAEAYGAVGMRITDEQDVARALQEAFATPQCVVMDFVVEQEENVFPMVPAGGALDQMVVAEK